VYADFEIDETKIAFQIHMKLRDDQKFHPLDHREDALKIRKSMTSIV
jgi:hypothetical protein